MSLGDGTEHQLLPHSLFRSAFLHRGLHMVCALPDHVLERVWSCLSAPSPEHTHLSTSYKIPTECSPAMLSNKLLWNKVGRKEDYLALVKTPPASNTGTENWMRWWRKAHESAAYMLSNRLFTGCYCDNSFSHWYHYTLHLLLLLLLLLYSYCSWTGTPQRELWLLISLNGLHKSKDTFKRKACVQLPSGEKR